MIVTLDGGIHDPSRPLLFADDLAAVRGDGIFETLLVRAGAACLTDSHLERLTQSARLMDLPEPDLRAWRAAIDTAVGQWTSWTAEDGALRLIYSRGRENGSAPTAYLTVNPVPARAVAARNDGISALLLDRGLTAVGSEAMPWLLAGAKTLSYAVNMAALRHAERHGAGDVVFVSSDGFILEGPRSTVVIATRTSDSVRLLTPPPSHPILRGTTQRALFDVAADKGYDCRYRALRPADLFAADGVWLVSAMTLAARVHTLDGRALLAGEIAAEFSELVAAAVLSDR
ncbi:MAG: aminodeoxychorismate lyase [Mycobacterium sp.]